jgi:hypothetical protein
MAVNLKAGAKAAEADFRNTKIGAVVLGPPSAGKSGLLGTFGVKTLYIYMEGESHGPLSISAHATSEVIPYCITRDDDNRPLNPDQALKRLQTLLADKETLKAEGIGAIALDGLTELEVLVTESATWKQRVVSEKDGNTSFAGYITISMIRPFLDQLRALQREIDVHYIVTGILDVQKYDDDGSILESVPKLKGYDVATGLILQFPDRLMIGHMTDGEGNSLPRLQTNATAHKTSKDFKTKVQRKTFNFRFQLAGCDMTTFPDTLRPDLSRLVKFKEAKKYFKIEG